jgi:hypothetical protein
MTFADVQEKFGITFDAATLAKVPIQMIVGDVDLETWEITHVQGSTHWMPGANDAGRTRPERLRALCRSFEEAGARVRFELLPGVAHERDAVLDPVKDFLDQALKERRNASR